MTVQGESGQGGFPKAHGDRADATSLSGASGGSRVPVCSLAHTGGLTPTALPIARFPPADEPGFHLATFHDTSGNRGEDRSLPLDSEALGQADYGHGVLGHIHRHEEPKPGGTLAVYWGVWRARGSISPR